MQERNADREVVILHRAVILCLSVVFLIGPASRAVFGQSVTSLGEWRFAAPEPVELGFIESANGGLHQEIRLGSFPQRGGRTLTASLVYDAPSGELSGTRGCRATCQTTRGLGRRGADGVSSPARMPALFHSPIPPTRAAAVRMDEGRISSGRRPMAPHAIFPSRRRSHLAAERTRRLATLMRSIRPASACTSPIILRRRFTRQTERKSIRW